MVDGREPIAEVCAASALDYDALALFTSEDAAAVMLHLVQSAGPRGRTASHGSNPQAIAKLRATVRMAGAAHESSRRLMAAICAFRPAGVGRVEV
jgi:hypothetical protein